MSKINKTSVETRLAIERRSAAMLPDRPTQAGLKPWDIRNALFTAIIADKGACLMGEIDRIVDETNAAIDAMRIKSGTLTVPMSRWKGEETPRTECVVNSIYTAGCAVLFMPEDDETKEQARLARLSLAINETVDGEWSDVVVFVGEGGEIPSVDLHFRYVVIPTESEAEAIVALVGVDAYGEGGGGTASGVDEEAVKALIGKEVPEWAMAKQKPAYTADEVKARPATWTPTAAEVGARPSTWMPTAAEVGARPNTWTPTAGEVGAESAGKVKTHNEDSGSHTDIRLDITTLRTMLNTVIGTDTGKSMRAVAALVVAEIVGDASDSFDTLEEIAAWIEAHPNDVAAMVKRITDLETAMGGKVSKTDIINTLDSTALDKPLSAAMGAKLNTLLTGMSDEIDGKTTPDQVAAKIKTALTPYILKEDADKAYQPAGDYASGDHNHDGAYQPKGNYAAEGHDHGDTYAAKGHDHNGIYAKPSDIPTVPQTLPNPYALTILGKTYTGGKAVSLTVEEIMDAIKAASGGVTAYLDGNKIVLSGNLPDATYTAYFEVDGELVKIGDLTHGSVTPDPVTYTIKWTNYGGEVLKTVTVAEGDSEPEYDGPTPTRAEDGQYTYTFKGWDKTVDDATGDVTYTATYTQTAKPTEPAEPTNFFKATPTVSSKTQGSQDAVLLGGRLGSDKTYRDDGGPDCLLTNYIHVQSGDIVEMTNLAFNTLNSAMYKSDKTMIGAFQSTDTAYVTSVSTSGKKQTFTVANANAGYVRVSGQPNSGIKVSTSGASAAERYDLSQIIINVKRNGVYR